MASRACNLNWAPPGPYEIAAMEANIIALLTASQSPVNHQRQAAEQELLQLYGNTRFPEALVHVAANPGVATNNRQAALNVVRQYVKKGWSDEIPGFQGVILPSEVDKQLIRHALLSIVLDDNVDSKITTGAAVVIADIAQGDYPYDWPNLFNDILGKVPTANNAQTQGILMVLAVLIDTGGIDLREFQREFHEIIKTIYGIAASDTQRVQTRAYALQTLRQATDTIHLVGGSEKQVAREMNQCIVDTFSKFFLEVLSEPMPTVPTKEQEDQGMQESKEWRDMVQLKIHVVKVYMPDTRINENVDC